MNEFTVIVGIILATFISEDLTCISVGLLIASGDVSLAVGLASCFAGIFLGDVGLWLIGRLAGRRLLRWNWFNRRLPAHRLEGLARWLDRNGAVAVFASRFLPGTRVPCYVASGMLGRKPGIFLMWLLIAAGVWSPLLVVSAWLFGDELLSLSRHWRGGQWAIFPLIALTLFVVIRLAITMFSPFKRHALHARLARIWRWEFWPTWIFYLPLVPWYLLLSIRYRSFTIWTAVNPAIPAGGVVGESKFAILSQLPSGAIIPSELIPTGEMEERIEILRRVVLARKWPFPLILKPDAAQRGAGVKKIVDWVTAEKYLQTNSASILIQPYHPGPHEVGVFYYRIPGEERGRIFSITEKVFPLIQGDGRSTIAELIWRHPRYRMQAEMFLKRHEATAGRILEAGEVFRLGIAGNHCQGTLFRDGGHLLTPALEQRIDQITRSIPAFHAGRFDIRFTDPVAFMAGEDIAIVELNGATAESTNLYDPARSLFSAYRILFRQWALLFHIGHRNTHAGVRPIGVVGLFVLLWSYYRHREVDVIAD